ncbi:S-layer homology domain-containing protein [Oscillospiraceae bacterium OttesenSCG-928-G22]|nr:S-layer homology domain-containing protein [Oscillospiraceae bacterium OttesenSCG-928-G22]
MLLYRAGIIEGEGVFDPQGSATRAEVAAMLHRFLERLR